jgi:hypothetical protein
MQYKKLYYIFAVAVILLNQFKAPPQYFDIQLLVTALFNAQFALLKI